LAVVTDSLFGNCATGGGSFSVICEWNGASWVVRTGASGPLGVTPRASTCASNVDTILSTDRAGYISWSDASACAVTLPQAGSTGFANNYVFTGCNIGAGTVTITPTTSTISFVTDSSYSSGASSVSLVTGKCIKVYSDNTNYFGVTTNNTVDATSAASAAKQVCVSSGASRTCSYIDFPNLVYAPTADNVNGVGGIGWTCPNATPVVLLRAGTNNKDALLSPWGGSDVCYFRIHLPKDWDSTASTDVSIDLTSTDATNGHTIIMQATSACAKGDGTTTDDVAFNTAQSFSTITLNGNANRTWTATLTGLTTTGCAAQSILWIKISRTTDTATNVGVYGAAVDAPRLLTIQAQ
jgi:hypothetical protein